MPAPRGLVQRLDQELHRSGPLPRGARLLVAVSGGADSVGLLRLLHAINGSDYWGWTLVVGHVDHGIRGAASAGDAWFVEGLAEELSVGFAMRELKLGADCSEMQARMRRDAALLEMVLEQDCAGVVKGHHADDQAETVVMRIFRGCGVDSLRGMSEETRLGTGLVVWRPLLRVRRSELRGYLAEIGQGWREDASNESSDYLRNRVRAEVMPVIEKIWPRGAEAVGRLARIARGVQDVMDVQERALWEKAQRHGGGFAFSRAALREAQPAVVTQVLRSAIVAIWGSSESADFERISEAMRLIQGREGGREIQMGRGVVIILDGDLVRVECNYGAGPEQEEGD